MKPTAVVALAAALALGASRLPAQTPADSLAEARAALKKGDAETAVKAATKAVQLDPQNVPAHFVLASALAATRQPDKAIAAFNRVMELDPKMAPIARDRRGAEYFKLGKIKESIEDFDGYLKAFPDQAPEHWRRGISLYYAGRYKDGVEQFETHKKVNPEDVENAAWHYLCKAKAEGVDKARGS